MQSKLTNEEIEKIQKLIMIEQVRKPQESENWYIVLDKLGQLKEYDFEDLKLTERGKDEK